MKRLIAAFACMAFLASAASTLGEPAASATDRSQVLLEFDLYRVRGDISGQTRVKKDLSVTDLGELLLPWKGQFRHFTLGELMVVGVKLRADDSGWTWDEEELLRSGKKVEMIASPRVLVLLGHSFEFNISSQQPIEYFEKRSDGLFELKRLHEHTGLSISGQVTQGGSEETVVCDLTFRLRSIEKRKPIEGVSLDVGHPIIGVRESKTNIAVKPGRGCGIVLGTEGYGNLLMRLRVDLVKPGGMDVPGIPESIR